MLEIPTLLVAVVKLTFCGDAACPDKALNVRVEGFAISVPAPPPVPGAYVTVTVMGVLPVALNVTLAVQGIVPQFVLRSWKYNVSGVVWLLLLNAFSQKGTPVTVYVTGFVPDAATVMNFAWLSFKPTVLELTLNCCALAGTAISSAVARSKAVFVRSL